MSELKGMLTANQEFQQTFNHGDKPTPPAKKVAIITCMDARIPAALDQALADLAALRIVDEAHPERPVVAAGAPWFMTLFGRDSLLTAWMTLPFDRSLASGVLASLADLQGSRDDPASEEQPGRIIHELRRHGGSGPFSSRNRYYGTVDATPLFVGLAAEVEGVVGLDQRQPAVVGALRQAVEQAVRAPQPAAAEGDVAAELAQVGGQPRGHARRRAGLPGRFHYAQVGRPTRAEADALCDRLRGAGGDCMVLRN